MLGPRPAALATEELTLFRDAVGHFLDRHAAPEAIAGWRTAKCVPRQLWREAGRAGLLGASMPEAHGGAAGDFRHEVVLIEEIAARGADGWGLPLHNGIVAPYIAAYGTDEQRARWLPRLCSGELVGAIAMTEPGAGSDLQAIRTTLKPDGNGWRLNGQKTFITNGQTADLILVVATGEPGAGAKAISIAVVETADAPGFARGRNLEKIGQEAQDTSELFFDDVALPATALLGPEPGRGFAQLMAQLPQERLIIAIGAVAATERALRLTIDYAKERRAFGQPLIAFQNTQFTLAEAKTQATIARVFVDHCVERLLAGTLDAATASMSKYWTTDLQCRVIDECLQLFGGYGYMADYPIAQMYKDARVQRIYGGTNEIMKLLIARTL